MPFVSFTLFIFSLFMFVSFYRWLSLLFLFPFPVFCLSLCFLLSFSFFVSFYCFYFFLALPSVAWFSLHFRFLFLPPSLPSFPYLSLLFVPVVGLSSFSSSPSFSSFLFPFGSLVFPFLSFSPFPLFVSSSFVSVSFPVPSSPLLAVSSSCWSELSPLCCVPLRCVSLSPFSPVSLLFLFLCLVCFFFFIFFLLSLFLSPPPLLPPFYFLAIFFFCFLGFVLFLCLAPSAFFSSASLSHFPSVSFSFCFFLCCLLFRFGCFSSSSWLSSPSSTPSLFRQNTYLQNKKHTLTCQRWDWLL